MKKALILISAAAFVLFIAGSALAEGVPWKDHQAPFDFMFGNHLDTHQQTKTMPDGRLFGFLYIVFTGERTPDGVPIARHFSMGDDPKMASVGWEIQALPGAATFVYNAPMDHPLWLVDTRGDIPQPGAYSHFHWLDNPAMSMDLVPGQRYEGYYLQLTARDTFALSHGMDLVYVTPGIDTATHANIVSVFPGYTDGMNQH